MNYEISLLVLLLIYLIFPFIYSSIWEPKVVNKSRDYFVVSKIERITMTFKRYVFFYIGFLWVVLAYDEVYHALSEGISGRKGRLIVQIAFLCIWIIISLLCCREHVALPMRRYLNAEEMIKSIESEKFYQIAEGLWHSQNWIRVSTKFYPKNAITGIKIDMSGPSATAVLVIDTIFGKSYKCYCFSQYDKQLHAKIQCLIDTLPISN